MCILRLQFAEGKYKENDRHLKEQFINGINDDDMTVDVIKELTTKKDMSTIISEQVLLWAKLIRAHTSQSAMLENLKENKVFDKNINLNYTIQQLATATKLKDKQYQKQQQIIVPRNYMCKYCGRSHLARQFPTDVRNVEDLERQTTTKKCAEADRNKSKQQKQNGILKGARDGRRKTHRCGKYQIT